MRNEKKWRAAGPFAAYQLNEMKLNKAKESERTNKLNFFFNLIDGKNQSNEKKCVCWGREPGGEIKLMKTAEGAASKKK